MSIEIRNCNNIDCASIKLDKNKLNIKFAPNGTGKSTISKALICSISGDLDGLKSLTPFKYLVDGAGDSVPSVTGFEEFESALCFNEDYVRKITFKPEELVSNSFDVLIRTEEYNKLEQEISDLVAEIQKQFSDNIELDSAISAFGELSGAFKINANGSLSKATSAAKSLSGNLMEHIPEELQPYKSYIKSEKNVAWIDWQQKGSKEFIGISDACPYCSLDTSEQKETIKKVSETYDKNTIKNLLSIINIVGRLGGYLSEETRNKLDEITKLKDGMEDIHESFIVAVKSQIDIFLDNLILVKTLSGFHFEKGDKVDEKLSSFKLNLKYFEALDSENTRNAINAINDAIDRLIQSAGVLQGKVGKQQSTIRKMVEAHQDDINNFLSYAGYSYKAEIVGDKDQRKLKLRHTDYAEFISGGDQHLSFGERNAFALVLFMYECLSKAPDLIVLDDPISSFDKNKKYAILEMLFRRRREKCLKGKTVLMLTHDVEPIIDTLKSIRDQFQGQVSASYLSLKSGSIVENKIEGSDIKTFVEICDSILSSEGDELVKLVYLRRRFEIVESKSDAYQVLSNLFHKRSYLIDTREDAGEGGEYPLMISEKIANGVSDIQGFIGGFSYESSLERMKDKDHIKSIYENGSNGYEKLQMFRLLEIEDFNNSVIRKFMNETYHIENEFICQLEPSKFDMIPEYVIAQCDDLVE